jgi:hypothetical protein
MQDTNSSGGWWRGMSQVPNEAKFKELMLYVAEKSASDPDFGATKLNKILFFSDFLAFARLGQPVTGVDYQRLKWGPAPRRLIPVQKELVESGEAAVIPIARGYTQKRLVALRSANLGLFTPDEVALVDSVIELLNGRRAIDVSELSHEWSLAWQSMSDGETIPYETVFWGPPEPSVESAEYARAIAKEYDLLDHPA